MNDEAGYLEEQLSSFVVRTNYEQLPLEAVETAKNAILDCLGVALAGSQEEAGRMMLEAVKEWGGKPSASVIGWGFRTSPPLAALANGVIAHALDYDDVSDSWLGHPSTVLVPAILAAGESSHRSGKDMISAYVVGFEVGAKLGKAVGERHYARGWHNTSTLGSIAGASAAAKLAGLDGQKTKSAMAIGASLAGGLRENFGTMVKPLHAGNAAKNAVLAATLARKGFSASEKAITGEQGFCRALGADASDLTEISRQLGAPFDIVSSGIWLKAYPSCAFTHACVEAALLLKGKHPFNPDAIVEVECAVSKFLPEVLIYYRPKTPMEGKFSLEYCVAVALLDGEVALGQFTEKRILASDVQALVSKVKYSHPPELSDKISLDLPAKVTIKLRNGQQLSRKVDTPTGKPKNPMSQKVLIKKFKDCVAHSGRPLSQQRVAEVLQMLAGLENVDDVSQIMRLLH